MQLMKKWFKLFVNTGNIINYTECRKLNVGNLIGFMMDLQIPNCPLQHFLGKVLTINEYQELAKATG